MYATVFTNLAYLPVAATTSRGRRKEIVDHAQHCHRHHPPNRPSQTDDVINVAFCNHISIVIDKERGDKERGGSVGGGEGKNERTSERERTRPRLRAPSTRSRELHSGRWTGVHFNYLVQRSVTVQPGRRGRVEPCSKAPELGLQVMTSLERACQHATIKRPSLLGHRGRSRQTGIHGEAETERQRG